MAGKSLIDKLFGRKKKLEDLDMEELNRERLRLKREENKLVAHIEQGEREKAALFEQAVGMDSKRQKTMLARRIKELDATAKHNEGLAMSISKQARIISGIIKFRENAELRQRLSTMGLVKNMDVSELAALLEHDAIEGELTDEKIINILKTLEEGNSMGSLAEDEDVLEIVTAMEEAAAAATEGNETAKTEGLSKVNEILSRKQDESGRMLEGPELA